MVYLRMVLAGLICVAACADGLAHHSTAMFDDDNPVTLTGTVQAFHWRNPHSMLVLDADSAKDSKGQAVAGTGAWSVELHSTAIMMRRGFTKDYFKPGDKVTVTGGRIRDGSSMIRLFSGSKADGTPFYGDDFRPEATGHNKPVPAN